MAGDVAQPPPHSSPVCTRDDATTGLKAEESERRANEDAEKQFGEFRGQHQECGQQGAPAVPSPPHADTVNRG